MAPVLKFPSLNSGLKYSGIGLKLTETFEGFKASAYQDQGGIWTIGYGHTGHDVHSGLVITAEQAEQLLAQDVENAENAIKRFVKVRLSQNQFDALVDFVFNVGSGNFLASTMLKLVNETNFLAASEQFERWDKVAGVANRGLARRRLSEAELFEHGVLQAAA